MKTGKERFLKYFLIMVASIALIGCGGQSGEDEGIDELVIALKPDKNPDAMMDDKSILEAYMEERLGISVEVRIPSSGAVIEQGLANGTIDLAFLSSTSTARHSQSGLAEVLLAGSIEGNPFYYSYWVTLVDNEYGSIADLKGKPICFASPTSTSGYIIPLWDLAQKGLITTENGPQTFFGENNVYFGTGYVSAIQQVFDGRAEAAAVSDYVIEKDKHLKPEEKEKLRIVQRQGPVPSHVLAVRTALPEETKASLKKALLELNESNSYLRDRIFSSKLIEVDSETHLKPIKEALDFATAIQ